MKGILGEAPRAAVRAGGQAGGPGDGVASADLACRSA